MRLRLLTALLLPAIFFGCKKSSDTATTTQIEVTVKTADGATVNNATIELFSDTHILITGTATNSSGKVEFSATAGKTYYIYHVAGDGKAITDAGASYITTGTFTSQSQINSSPRQTPVAKVGEDIHLDVNSDGVVDKFDLVKKVTTPAASGTDEVSLVIGPQ